MEQDDTEGKVIDEHPDMYYRSSGDELVLLRFLPDGFEEKDQTLPLTDNGDGTSRVCWNENQMMFLVQNGAYAPVANEGDGYSSFINDGSAVEAYNLTELTKCQLETEN